MANARLSLMEKMGSLYESSKKSTLMTERIISINDFPDEILLKILSYFTPEELCLIIAEVCQRWNALAKDVTLWKTLSYKCDDLSTFTSVVEVLIEAPMLKSLEIQKRDDAAQLMELLFDSCDGIKRLVIKFCNLGDDSMDVLAKIVTFYPELEELELVGCHTFTYTGGTIIIQNLSPHCNQCGHCIKEIADNCTRLQELCIDDVTTIFDEDIIHVIRKVGAQLTTFILDGEELTDNSFCYLDHCTRLQVLEISFCDQMTDRGLLGGIGALQQLTSLRLKRGHNLTAQALSTFLHRPAMACIVRLNLTECSNLDDYGLEGIANRCVHLMALSLGWCWEVTDAGILKLICNCNKLQILDLLGVVRITGFETDLIRRQDMRYWILCLGSHTFTITQNTEFGTSNNVSEELLTELVAAMPQLEVIDYYGERVQLQEEKDTVLNDNSTNLLPG
ncbi:hypothetical protein L9F63_017102, partial [Diploptera punctata]